MVRINEKYDLTRKKTISLVMALANKIINELNFVETINRYTNWDEGHQCADNAVVLFSTGTHYYPI